MVRIENLPCKLIVHVVLLPRSRTTTLVAAAPPPPVVAIVPEVVDLQRRPRGKVMAFLNLSTGNVGCESEYETCYRCIFKRNPTEIIFKKCRWYDLSLIAWFVRLFSSNIVSKKSLAFGLFCFRNCWWVLLKARQDHLERVKFNS